MGSSSKLNAWLKMFTPSYVTIVVLTLFQGRSLWARQTCPLHCVHSLASYLCPLLLDAPLCTAIPHPAHQMFQHWAWWQIKENPASRCGGFFPGFLAYIHQMIENVYAFIYVDTFPTRICEFRNILFRPLYLDWRTHADKNKTVRFRHAVRSTNHIPGSR